MKKAIIAGTSIATMAILAMPALASVCNPWCPPQDPCPCPTNITVSNLNESQVHTANISVSNTGLNGISQHGKINLASIGTGNTSAIAGVQNQVGFNQVEIKPISNGNIGISNVNYSHVGTINAAVSNSGANHVTQGGMINAAKIETGTSGTSASVVNLVGQNLVEIK